MAYFMLLFRFNLPLGNCASHVFLSAWVVWEVLVLSLSPAKICRKRAGLRNAEISTPLPQTKRPCPQRLMSVVTPN